MGKDGRAGRGEPGSCWADTSASPRGRLQVPEAPPEPSAIESTLAERAAMYRTAIASARQAGDGSRLRRYERGLKVSRNRARRGWGAPVSLNLSLNGSV